MPIAANQHCEISRDFHNAICRKMPSFIVQSEITAAHLTDIRWFQRVLRCSFTSLMHQPSHPAPRLGHCYAKNCAALPRPVDATDSRC